MRSIGTIVGVVLLLVGIVVFMKMQGASPSSSGVAGSPSGNAGSRAGPGGGSGGSLADADREALARLEAELARATPVAFRTDTQRLDDARAWVAANRPADRPFNEIEAEILALMDVMFDGEKKSPEWMMNTSQIEVELIRALDADGDGQVSDAEVQLFIDENIAGMFNPLEHPYLKARLDTNGDGVLQPEEMARVASMVGEGPMSGVFDRAKLEAWDTDNNGVVSADELAAGESTAEQKARDLFGDLIARQGGEAAKALLGDPSLSPEEQNAARQKLYDQVGEQAAIAIEAQRQMMVSQAASQDWLEAMRVDNLPSPDIKALLAQMPTQPDPTSFDIDGDGTLADDEQAAQVQAMQDYQQAVAQWGSEVTAYRLKAQFENSLTQSDTNGDGRMSPDEWSQRMGTLLSDRDQRLFNRSYDLNQSGRVDASEVATFLDWYKTGSLRADVNYDGTIDARDLSEMATRFQQQGG